MSWTNNGGNGGKGGGSGGGGPWKPSGNPGPWGQGPNSPQRPDLGNIMRGLEGRFRKMGGGGGLGLPGILIVILVGVGLWLLSGFYTVGPNQVGLNLVFGKYTDKTSPGLNHNWPFPIGSVRILNVTDRNAFNVGFVTRPDYSRPNATTLVDVPEESLMLTGDENIADVKFVVFWQIDPSHPEYFAFNIADQSDTVKAVAESAMREVVGRSQIQKILTAERKVIEPAVQVLMQKVLNSYDAGVLVLQVQLQSVDPPDEVIASFRDVTASQQDQAKLQNEGQAYANTVVPKANGEAAAIVQKAEGYRTQTVAEAQGQAARFDKVYAEYKNAPAVTRQRMYLETMEQILARSQKVLIDDPGGKGVVPYLPLPALGKSGDTP
jgi:membrane protease subunit HflK